MNAIRFKNSMEPITDGKTLETSTQNFLNAGSLRKGMWIQRHQDPCSHWMKVKIAYGSLCCIYYNESGESIIIDFEDIQFICTTEPKGKLIILYDETGKHVNQ